MIKGAGGPHGAAPEDIHFRCTQCGKCCNKLKIPLTAAEAVDWLNDGHRVQVILEAIPWLEEFPSDDQQAAHRRRRSFAAMSGRLPVRIVVILAADISGACPNLKHDLRCGIYERRPLVCRIYPAEINPFIRLEPTNKACPPEAWGTQWPLLQRDGRVVDEAARRDIARSREADFLETRIKRSVCAALKIMDTALAHEGFVMYSPAGAALQAALSSAMAAQDAEPASGQWRFVSNQAGTLDDLARSGAIAIHSDRANSASYEYLSFKPGPKVPSG